MFVGEQLKSAPTGREEEECASCSMYRLAGVEEHHTMRGGGGGGSLIPRLHKPQRNYYNSRLNISNA